MSEPRTEGGSLLRAAMEEAQRQIDAEDDRRQVAVFGAFDMETGAQIGAAYHWRGAQGSEWAVTGALARKVTSAQKPYRIELRITGKL